jgi:D-amino-acid dehydrogenase
MNPSGPLWIRPTLEPALLEWIARFVVSCRRSVYQRGLAALQQAAALAGPAFDALAARDVEFEQHEAPLVYPAFEQPELAHLWGMVDELHRARSRQRIDRLSADELKALEPALSGRVLGGVIAHGERRVRPERLTAGVHRALVGRGVEVLETTPATALTRDGRDWHVAGPAGGRSADAVVIASGVESVRLLAPHGVRVPVAAAKGYSRTYPVDATGPRQALYLEDPKVAISVFDEGVRVSGTLELGARGLALSARRLDAITAAARKALPGWQMPPQPREWAGMRSLAPDGLPFIGPVPGMNGVHLATAHGTLGITLAPLTGQLLAGMLLDGTGNELLSAFAPARAVRN